MDHEIPTKASTTKSPTAKTAIEKAVIVKKTKHYSKNC